MKAGSGEEQDTREFEEDSWPLLMQKYTAN